MSLVGFESYRRLLFLAEGGNTTQSGLKSTDPSGIVYQVPITMYRSPVIVEQDNLGGWSINVTLNDPGTKFSMNMLTEPVFFEGGYARQPKVGESIDHIRRLLFVGYLTRCATNFLDNGETHAIFEAHSDYILMTRRERNISWGSVATDPKAVPAPPPTSPTVPSPDTQQTVESIVQERAKGTLNDPSYDDAISQASEKYGVDAKLIRAVIYHESRFKPATIGSVGEVGLMQIAPVNWNAYGVTAESLKDPGTNIDVGTQILRAQSINTGGVVNDTLSAYNGGYRPDIGFGKILTKATRIKDKGLVPAGNYANQDYVDAVRRHYDKLVADELRNQASEVANAPKEDTKTGQDASSAPDTSYDITEDKVDWNREGITLKEIIVNLVKSYGFQCDENDVILPDTCTDRYTPKDPLVQKNESDWQFLIRMSRKYNCSINIIPGTRLPDKLSYNRLKSLSSGSRFQFISDEYRFKNPDSHRGTITFLRHKQGGKVVPPDRVNVFSDKTTLPIWGVSTNIDTNTAIYGYAFYQKNLTDGEVVEMLAPVFTTDNTRFYDDTWEINDEKVFIDGDRSKGLTKEAEAYKKLPLSKRLNWEKARPFFRLRRDAAGIDGHGQNARGRYWERKWLLTFTTFGNVTLQLGKIYTVDGIGGYSGDWVLTKLTHIFDQVYTMKVEMRR